MSCKYHREDISNACSNATFSDIYEAAVMAALICLHLVVKQSKSLNKPSGDYFAKNVFGGAYSEVEAYLAAAKDF